MTLKSWKQEFYPKRPNSKMSTKEAIEHSLQKWIGLRMENLKKHEVMVGSFNTFLYGEDDGTIEINGSTCALCHKFYSSASVLDEELDSKIACPKCPLQQTLGQVCDSNEAVEEVSVYGKWIIGGDPEPMIAALEKTLERYNNE